MEKLSYKLKKNNRSQIMKERIFIMPAKLSETEAKSLLFYSLQGLAAISGLNALFFEGAEYDYTRHISSKENALDKEFFSDYWQAFESFSQVVTEKGYILVDLVHSRRFLNAATTVSGMEKYLLCDITLEEEIKKIGFIRKINFSEQAPSEKEIFDKYYDRLNKSLLVHQTSEKIQLRDFAIAKQTFCFYTNETEAEKEFRKYVFARMPLNIPVLGWTDDEISFVRDASEYGKYVIPADWAENLSYLSARPVSVVKQRYTERQINADENKHYIAFVVSDGDNIQWMLRNFSTESLYGQRLKRALPYRITWTISPSLINYAPDVLKNIYDKAPETDSFISSVSGVGYINPMSYPEKYLRKFSASTSSLMKKSDLRYLTILDDGRNITEETLGKLKHYANRKQIKGVIWEQDPDRYEYGKGKTYQLCNKAFMSVRLSLWQESNKRFCVTDDWLKSKAQKINSAARNPYGEEGYSVINVHPWTMEMEDLDKFVSYLSPDIEIVSAGELINIYTENVLAKKNMKD